MMNNYKKKIDWYRLIVNFVVGVDIVDKYIQKACVIYI